LQNGNTYYASQTINGCERQNSILINIQNTAAPTENYKSDFCSSQNDFKYIVISGTAIQYNNIGTLLPNATPLQDGVTYYATQTENGCEPNANRRAVTIS
jgi:hypothetical protein